MRIVLYFLLLITSYAEKSIKVDVYPGFGWDHLRFLDMNPVYDVSNFNDSALFQSCIEMIPLHENKIETGSTVIDTFDSHSSEYSSNLLIGGSGGYGGFKMSGSYSNDYQKIKKEQGQEKTVTLRNHIDYLMVDVMLQSSCRLHPQVKSELIKIAEYATTGKVLSATYAAQLFVKKYGTHVTSRLYLGGSISEDDFVSHSTFSSSDFDKRAQKAAAEASFLGTFSLSASFSLAWTNANNDANEYKKNIQRKIIQAKGGDVLPMANSIQAWQSSVKAKPVIIRRAIENMTYIIQSDKIPELTESALAEVRQKITEAIETYVDMNAVRGCMNRDSPSFNWVANIDDGSCAPASLDAQFGGFVQTCTEDSRMPP